MAVNRGERAWYSGRRLRGILSCKMKQTPNTSMVFVGGGSHSGEWRGGGILSGARGKATAVTRVSGEALA